MKRLRVRILAGVVGEFSSLQSTLCADSYSVSVTPLVTTVACKRPWPFCQKCRWQVTPKHAYHLDPLQSEWADYAAVQAECGNLSRNELTRNSSENTKLQLSQLAQLLWTDPGLKSGISLRQPISTLKKRKKEKRRRGMKCGTISQNPRTRGKSHQHHIRQGSPRETALRGHKRIFQLRKCGKFAKS